MARLSYVDPADMSDDLCAQLQRLPINLTRMLLHAPRTASGFLDMAIGFRQGVLDPRLRETVILRVALIRTAYISACSTLRRRISPACLVTRSTLSRVAI